MIHNCTRHTLGGKNGQFGLEKACDQIDKSEREISFFISESEEIFLRHSATKVDICAIHK